VLAVATADHAPGPTSWAVWACGVVRLRRPHRRADGYLARRWNAISRFGRIMDPLADKLLILGAFVMLAGG
jgi:phosphatidylglycerophosphate synthase